jgi:hypothetical protein
MKRCAMAALIMILCAACTWLAWNKFWFEKDSDYTNQRLVRYAFTVTNTTNQVVHGAKLMVRAPVAQTTNQKCAQVTGSHPFEILQDDIGNRVLCFALSDIAPYASRIITVTATLMMAEKTGQNRLSDRAAWMAAEPFIEADDPGIRAEAKKMIDGNKFETAAKINAWTANHIVYDGYAAKERGALYAYKHGKGDCTEYMDLFVALSRAADIPARGLSGFVCPDSANLSSKGYHNFAEFYDGKTWRTADPQNRVFVDKAKDYVVMRVISDAKEKPDMRFDRFRIIGEGLKAVMNNV